MGGGGEVGRGRGDESEGGKDEKWGRGEVGRSKQTHTLHNHVHNRDTIHTHKCTPQTVCVCVCVFEPKGVWV